MRFRISPSTTPVVVQLSFSIPIDDPLLLLVIHYQSLPVAPPFPTGKIDRCRVYFSRSSRFWARPSHFWKPRDPEDCAYLLRSPWNTVEHRRSVPGNDGESSRKLDDRYLRSSAPIVYTPTARSVLRLEGHFVRCVAESIVNIVDGIPPEIRSGRGIIDAVAGKGNRVWKVNFEKGWIWRGICRVNRCFQDSMDME